MNGLPSIIIGALRLRPARRRAPPAVGFAGSVALAIIMLPLIARGSQEVLLLVPDRPARSRRRARRQPLAHGAHASILPSALGGIVTSTVLAVARAAGETAPLILAQLGLRQRAVSVQPLRSVPNIPVTIFTLSEEANPEGFTRAWGAALVLVSFILFASLGARALLARSRSKMSAMSVHRPAGRGRLAPSRVRIQTGRRRAPAQLGASAATAIGSGRSRLRRAATSRRLLRRQAGAGRRQPADPRAARSPP